MYCLRCGSQLPDDAAFCMKCGASQTQGGAGSRATYSNASDGSSTHQVLAASGVTSLKCPNCIKPGALILGDNVAISQMSPGGHALGLSGIVKVNETFVRSYKGDMLRVHASGILPIELTPEHPILTVRRSRTHDRMGEPNFSAPIWRHAHDIKPYNWKTMSGDYLLVPVPRGCFNDQDIDLRSFTTPSGFSIAKAKGYPTSLPLEVDTAWLLGMYVAEGCAATKEVIFSLGKHEKEIQERIMRIARSLGYSPYMREAETTMVVGIPSRILARAFAGWCGKRAPNKRIPDFILLHVSERIIKSFFSAVASGDGYEFDKRGVRNVRISTTSKLLAMQLQLVSARLGHHLAINQANKRKTGVILGRKVRLHEKYEVRGQVQAGKRQAIKSVGDFLFTPVRAIGKGHYSGPVHNLGTQDGTYLVSNAVVHNCGAPITPKFGEMVITCEYCGSGVTLGSDGWRSIQKQTMLPLRFPDQKSIIQKIHDVMDKGFMHRHLQETSNLEEVSLTVVPYWVIPASARTSVVATDVAVEVGSIATTAALIGVMGAAMGGERRGGGGFAGPLLTGAILGSTMGPMNRGGQVKTYEMDENYNFPVVAIKALSDYQPKNYQFRLEERTLFDVSKVPKGVKVLNGDIGEDVASYQAKTLVDQLQSDKAHAKYHMIQKMQTDIDVGEGELLHAPIWFARYDHKGGKIVLIIDGNSGEPVNTMGI